MSARKCRDGTRHQSTITTVLTSTKVRFKLCSRHYSGVYSPSRRFATMPSRSRSQTARNRSIPHPSTCPRTRDGCGAASHWITDYAYRRSFNQPPSLSVLRSMRAAVTINATIPPIDADHSNARTLKYCAVVDAVSRRTQPAPKGSE